MNTTDINGFEIDQFNQHDLKVGAKDSICPKCSHERSNHNAKTKCASLDWDTGIGTCHHCDETFQLHTFKRKGGGNKIYVKPVWRNETNLSDNVIRYFEGRGISQDTLVKLRVTEGKEWMPQTRKEENTIQFNYFVANELINIKYRDGRKNFKLVKDAEKVFYNLDSTVGSDSVVIVEGEMDVLSLHESGVYSVVSVPNGATLNRLNLDYLDNCVDYFTDKSKIILAVDSDEAGENLKTELIRRFGAEVCFTVDFGESKDANGFLTTYDGASLKYLIDEAPPVPLENVQTLKDIHEEFTDFIKNGFKPGYQVGLPEFDSVFSTYTGQFITVTGIPSSGKSDFVDQMVVGYQQKYGWKTAYASPENKPTFLHAHKLYRKIYGRMPSEYDLATEAGKKAYEVINDNFYFMEFEDGYSLESVLAKGAELVKRKGIRCLVIDPFNKVKLKKGRDLSITDYTMEYLNTIDIFCKKYDVLVFIVAHPTKMYKDANGNLEEPTMYSIKGGGEWYDASYHGLLVHRDYVAGTTKVKVLKCKFQNLGQNGAETYFTWEPNSGLFKPHEVETSLAWE